jgi:hypothetical protein
VLFLTLFRKTARKSFKLGYERFLSYSFQFIIHPAIRHSILSATVNGIAVNKILSRVGVTYKTGFRLDDWIYFVLYIHTVRDYRQYSAITILHTLQFTVAHILGFSVFTSRILATDLSHSHCNFISHMKSSCHYSAGVNSEDSTTFDYSELLFYIPSRLLTVSSYNSSARTPRKTPSSVVKNACLLVRYVALDVLLCPSCCGNVFTDPLPGNMYTRHNMKVNDS